MSTIYLHVGMPKTGTTFLQVFLERNRKRLLSKGVAFPIFDYAYDKVNVNRNAFFLKRLTQTGNNAQNGNLATEIYNNNLKTLESLKDKVDKIILTDESLWNCKRTNWREVSKDLMQLGFDTKIVVYLRRQDSFVQSLWAQKVKAGITKPFKSFLESSFLEEYDLDYYKKLQSFAQYFGKENIIVRIYDTNLFTEENKTLVSDFLEAIEVEYSDSFVEPQNTKINPSLSGIYLESKRLLNEYPEFRTHQNWGTKLLISLLLENEDFVDFNSNQFFDYRSCRKFLRKFSHSNFLVAKEYLKDSKGQLFKKMPFKKSFDRRKNYELSNYVHIFAQMLIKQQQRIEELEKTLHK